MKNILLSNHHPLFVNNNNKLITYKRGNLYEYNIITQNLIKLKTISKSFSERILSVNGLVSRVLRLGIKTSILLSNKQILFNVGKAFYIYYSDSENLERIPSPEKRSRPLYFCEIKDIDGFDDRIVYGEYFNNPGKVPVSIFIREKNNEWKIVYSFPRNCLNHIHNMVPDKYNKCVWILAGDFGDSAGIWCAKNNFKEIKPVLVGEQIYRACVAFPTKDGLLYATDTPLEPNSIRLLTMVNSKFESIEITKIKGSVIYGCMSGEKFVFSTTVEPSGIYGGKWEAFTTKKRGPGICDNNMYIYYGDLKDNFKIIYQAYKDFYPYVIFQFGKLMFPNCQFNSSYLPVMHIATKKYDMSTLILKIENTD